jgi:hypothetical protein
MQNFYKTKFLKYKSKYFKLIGGSASHELEHEDILNPDNPDEGVIFDILRIDYGDYADDIIRYITIYLSEYRNSTLYTLILLKLLEYKNSESRRDFNNTIEDFIIYIRNFLILLKRKRLNNDNNIYLLNKFLDRLILDSRSPYFRIEILIREILDENPEQKIEVPPKKNLEQKVCQKIHEIESLCTICFNNTSTIDNPLITICDENHFLHLECYNELIKYDNSTYTVHFHIGEVPQSEVLQKGLSVCPECRGKLHRFQPDGSFSKKYKKRNYKI